MAVNLEQNKNKFLSQVCALVEENRLILEKTYESFLRLKISLLEENELKSLELLRSFKKLTEILTIKYPESEFVAILRHLEAIRENNLKIVHSVKRKNREKVLFSGKAVNELKEVFDGVNDLLLHTKDLLVTNNPAIAKYLSIEYREISSMISDFGTEHEDRLVRGVCLPQSSIIYLLILDAFNSMLVHVNEINKIIVERNKKKGNA